METITKKTTGSVRVLLEQAYKICGCPNPERLGKMATMAYDAALVNGSVYDDNEEDRKNIGSRIFPLHPIHFGAEYPNKANIIYARLGSCEAASYLVKGKISEADKDKAIARFYSDASKPDAEIDAILTYEQALMGFWGI